MRTPSPVEDTNEAVKPVVHVKKSKTDTVKPSESTMKLLKREDEFLTSSQCSGLVDDTMLNTPTGTNVEFARLFGGPQQKTEDAFDKRGGKTETASGNGMSKKKKSTLTNLGVGLYAASTYSKKIGDYYRFLLGRKDLVAFCMCVYSTGKSNWIEHRILKYSTV